MKEDICVKKRLLTLFILIIFTIIMVNLVQAVTTCGTDTYTQSGSSIMKTIQGDTNTYNMGSGDVSSIFCNPIGYDAYWKTGSFIYKSIHGSNSQNGLGSSSQHSFLFKNCGSDTYWYTGSRLAKSRSGQTNYHTLSSESSLVMSGLQCGEGKDAYWFSEGYYIGKSVANSQNYNRFYYGAIGTQRIQNCGCDTYWSATGYTNAMKSLSGSSNAITLNRWRSTGNPVICSAGGDGYSTKDKTGPFTVLKSVQGSTSFVEFPTNMYSLSFTCNNNRTYWQYQLTGSNNYRYSIDRTTTQNPTLSQPIGTCTYSTPIICNNEPLNCLGTEPIGDNIIKGPNFYQYSGSTLSWTESSSASISTPCKFKCPTGYIYLNEECVMQQHTLTLTKVGGASSGSITITPGTNCGTSCTTQSNIYDHGTSVTLTANAASGYIFSSWGGACSGTSSSCSVSMIQDRSVTANFASDCVSESDNEFCNRHNRECESYTANDNCGISRTVNCGSCSSGYTCSNGVCVESASCSTPEPSGEGIWTNIGSPTEADQEWNFYSDTSPIGDCAWGCEEEYYREGDNCLKGCIDDGTLYNQGYIMECYDGPLPLYFGAPHRCLMGEKVCQSDGTWSNCENWIGPEEESISQNNCGDGIDNDCTGEWDWDTQVWENGSPVSPQQLKISKGSPYCPIEIRSIKVGSIE
jgi:hypothetical protein